MNWRLFSLRLTCRDVPERRTIGRTRKATDVDGTHPRAAPAGKGSFVTVSRETRPAARPFRLIAQHKAASARTFEEVERDSQVSRAPQARNGAEKPSIACQSRAGAACVEACTGTGFRSRFFR
jgi:hypothetical protein